jgi:hypothetical protein|nr:MAG TPA: Protein melan-A [Caudoviricetes sp.]
MIDFDRLRGWLLGLIVCAIITLLAGCKTTKYVPVENVRTEFKDRVVTVHDTVRDSVLKLNDVYKHDSMAVMMRGDTVFVDRWHTLRLIKWEQATHMSNTVAGDSASAVRTDSVRVPYPVERKLTKWERVKMDFGTAAIVIAALAIMAGIVLAVWWIRKRIRGNLR